MNRPTPPTTTHSCLSIADEALNTPFQDLIGTDGISTGPERGAGTRFPFTTFSLRLTGLVLCTSAFAACGAGDTPNTPAGPPPVATSTSVNVSVAAADSDGDQLHYRWAATEGTINNSDTPTTTWTVPTGSGVQFAYVLVSDDRGGYTESRAVALTFDAVSQSSSTEISVPPDSGKAFIWGTLYYEGFGRHVYLPDWDVQVSGPGGTFSAKTDLKGEFFFPGLAQASTYSFRYKVPGQNAFASGDAIKTAPLPTSPSAENYSRQRISLSGTLHIAGSVRMADDSYCGVRDEFFVKSTDARMLQAPITASAELLDGGNALVGTPNPRPRATVNHYGDYLIVLNQLTSTPIDAKVRITCETLTEEKPYTNGLSGQQKGPSFRLSNHRPAIQSLTVTRNGQSGQDVARPDFPKATTLLPEIDLAPGDDAFLTYKGLDTRKGACAYYHKIGAVQGCNPEDGAPTGAQLTLDQWQKRFNLSPYHDRNPEETELKAIYINKSDLNLGRDMQGIKRKDGSLAFNVCNYPGPQDVNDPLGKPKLIGKETEPDINLAIENARRGIGRIVCVAMDYSVTPGLNNDKPFVKFYTFGPTGKLLLSVSLDGRREKFMPGICVSCHGGDSYGGKFPDDYGPASPANSTGTGQANLGSFFLPFDVANLNYSTSDPARTRTALLKTFRQMNELLASFTASTPSDLTRPVTNDVKTLITTRWYPAANTDNQQTFPSTSNYELFAEGKLNVLGQQIQGQQFPGNGTTSCIVCHDEKNPSEFGPHDSIAKYVTVIAPSCLICHSSNAGVSDLQAGNIRSPLDFAGTSPRITFILRPPSHYLVPRSRGSHPVCGGSKDLKANHMMPNSLSAFERFWQAGSIQPQALFTFGLPKSGPQPGACTSLSAHPEL